MTQGDLQLLARPFYDALRAQGLWIAYPWTEESLDIANRKTVTRKEAQLVFSFDWKKLIPQIQEQDRASQPEAVPTARTEGLAATNGTAVTDASLEASEENPQSADTTNAEVIQLESPKSDADPGSSGAALSSAFTEIVGFTPGSPAVEQGGAATYRIPIVVSPGSGGMQPKLALAYSSRGGNGIMGVGWTLEGLSSITRCPSTRAQDGWIDGVDFQSVTSPNRDRYCLDGQRLMAISNLDGVDGAEYRTEINSFTKVISYGQQGKGPSYFKAWTKSGLILTFGNTADSRLTTTGESDGTILNWAVSRIEDTAGNFMRLIYSTVPASGEQYLSEIDYTGNGSIWPSARVIFVFATRTDSQSGFVAGSKTAIAKRLTKIRSEVEVDGAYVPARTYTLTYENGAATLRSRLASLQESVGVDAYRATTFEYTEAAENLVLAQNASDQGAFSQNEFWSEGDFNGDGRCDLAKISRQTDGKAKIEISLSNGSTIGGRTEWTSNSSVDFYSSDRWLPGDFTGDGRLDLARITLSNGKASVRILRNLGNSFSYETWAFEATTLKTGTLVLPADYDGDGKLDLALLTGDSTDGTSGNQTSVILRNTGTGFLAQIWANGNTQRSGRWFVGDFTGDGLPDLARLFDPGTGATVHLLRNNFHSGTGSFSTETWLTGGGSIPMQFWQTGDFNGDGLQDLLAIPTTVTGSTVQNVFLATGRSFARADWGRMIAASNPTELRVGDFNGDQRSDFVLMTRSRTLLSHDAETGLDFFRNEYSYRIYFSSGGGFAAQATAGTHSTYSSSRSTEGTIQWLAADFTGDGKEDLGRVFNRGEWTTNQQTTGTARLDLWTSNNVRADLLTTVTNGLGLVSRFVYSTLCNSAIYTPGTVAVAPTIDLTVPIVVVQRALYEDGREVAYAIDYRYKGLQANPDRGLVGFAEMTAQDHRSEATVKTKFRQDFPYIGQPWLTVTTDANGKLLARTSNTHSTVIQHQGKVRFPFIQENISENFEINAANSQISIITTETTPSQDDYANALQVLVTASDGYQKKTISTFANDAATWRIGRVLTGIVTSSGTNLVSSDRRSSFAYDATTGQVSRETIQPSDGALTLNTDYTYDQFGNILTTTVSGADIVTRVTTTGYDPKGRFATSETNALGHQTTRTYSPIHGAVLSVTDPNGLTTASFYDAFGRKTRELRPDQTETLIAWQWPQTGAPSFAAYYVSETPAGGPPVIIYFDKFGREVQRQTVGAAGRWVIVESRHDSLGRKYRTSRPGFPGAPQFGITSTFDSLNRIVSISTPKDGGGASITNYAYTYSAALQRSITTVTDALNHTTTSQYNSQNQLVRVTDHVGGKVDYTYDVSGKVARTSDVHGNATDITYDARGQKTGISDPDMGSWTYRYNAAGELIQQTDANGQSTFLSYDRLGRMTTREEPEGTTTWSYDGAVGKGNGQLFRSEAHAGNLTTNTIVSYDDFGRLIREEKTDASGYFVTDTAYDAFSRVDRITYPNGVAIKHVYDSNGYLKQVRRDSQTGPLYWQALDFNADGKVTREQAGNGVQTARVFSAETGLLRELNSSVQQLRYVWDAVGNLTQRRDLQQLVNGQPLTENFVQDGVNRLTSATVTGQPAATVSYDQLGNILTKNGWIYSYAQNASGQAVNHWVAAVNGVAYTYDGNGNITSGGGRTLEWTSFNLPLSIVKGAAESRFGYGVHREMVSHEVWQNGAQVSRTIYVSDYERVEEGAVIKHRVHVAGGIAVITLRTEPGQTATETTRWLHQDHLGSVSAVTNESGAAIERHSFDAWGKRRATDWQPAPAGAVLTSAWSLHGFTGHEQLDAVGLVHMKGRVYDPELGRFTSADPYEEDATVPGMHNRYSYVLNRPLSATDPSGHFVAIIAGLIAGAGGAAAGTAIAGALTWARWRPR